MTTVAILFHDSRPFDPALSAAEAAALIQTALLEGAMTLADASVSGLTVQVVTAGVAQRVGRAA